MYVSLTPCLDVFGKISHEMPQQPTRKARLHSTVVTNFYRSPWALFILTSGAFILDEVQADRYGIRKVDIIYLRITDINPLIFQQLLSRFVEGLYKCVFRQNSIQTHSF